MTRGIERSVSFRDAIYVLKNGIHNQEKTAFDYKRQLWKYAIEGQTTDGTRLRVIVAFDKKMVVITIIKLVKKKHEK